MNSLLLKDIPNQEKPRERLIKYGVNNLSTSDLIAIILKTGTKDCSVRTLSNNILTIVKDISDFKEISLNSLMSIHGVGKVKGLELIAAIELGRRVYCEKNIDSKINLNNPQAIYDYFKYLINDSKQEYFYCIYLDNKKKLIDKRLLFLGTINMSVVHPREVFKYAYLCSASSIICIHNHPSGNSNPSIEDINITSVLVEISHIQGIKIIDHIIIGEDEYYSFYENKKI